MTKTPEKCIVVFEWDEEEGTWDLYQILFPKAEVLDLTFMQTQSLHAILPGGYFIDIQNTSDVLSNKITAPAMNWNPQNHREEMS